MRILPSVEYLNEALTYDPISGYLYWKERPRHHFTRNRTWLTINLRYAGKIAGTEHRHEDGDPQSINVGICGTLFVATRIIYALMGIDVPPNMLIDHQNTNPFDNRWLNLRLATHSHNSANQSKRYKRKYPHLPKGVSPTRQGTFRAFIKTGGKQISLGVFADPDLAHAAYCAKATELFGDFARGN